MKNTPESIARIALDWNRKEKYLIRLILRALADKQNRVYFVKTWLSIDDAKSVVNWMRKLKSSGLPKGKTHFFPA